jgi:broad specificity phosphatase PhoE
LLVRHGEHAHGGRFWQHGCPGLTERGRQQTEATAAAFAATNLNVDAIAASQAARAWQTAEIIATPHTLVVDRTCSLCEMHPGEAEGMTVEEMNASFGPNYGEVPGAEYHPSWLPGAIERLEQLANAWIGHTVDRQH